MQELRLIPPAQIWVLSKFLHYRLLLGLATIGSLIDIILFSSPPFFIASITRELFDERYYELAIWILLFAVVAIIQSVSFLIGTYNNEVLAHRISTDITAELFQALQGRSMTYLNRLDLGEIMSRATNDTRRLNIGISPAYREFLIAIAQVFVITGFLWYFDSRFIPLFLAMILIYFTLLFGYVRRFYPFEKRILTDFDKVSTTATEALSGIRELKSFIAERRYLKMFRHYSQIHVNTNYQIGKGEALYFPELALWVGVGIAAIAGFSWIISQTLTISSFIGAFGSFKHSDLFPITLAGVV